MASFSQISADLEGASAASAAASAEDDSGLPFGSPRSAR